MVSNVKGAFSKVTGTINYDPSNLAASSVDATIEVSTVDTRQPMRDADLRSPNFFDVAQYPTITFKSKKFYREGNQVKVKGDLTMHGVTKEVVLDVDGPSPEVKDPWGNQRLRSQRLDEDQPARLGIELQQDGRGGCRGRR